MCALRRSATRVHKLKLNLPASFADMLQMNQGEVRGMDPIVSSNLPVLIGCGRASITVVVHRAVLVLLLSKSSQDVFNVKLRGDCVPR